MSAPASQNVLRAFPPGPPHTARPGSAAPALSGESWQGLKSAVLALVAQYCGRVDRRLVGVGEQFPDAVAHMGRTMFAVNIFSGGEVPYLCRRMARVGGWRLLAARKQRRQLQSEHQHGSGSGWAGASQLEVLAHGSYPQWPRRWRRRSCWSLRRCRFSPTAIHKRYTTKQTARPAVPLVRTSANNT